MKLYPYLFVIVGLWANQHIYPMMGSGRPGGNIGRTLMSQAEVITKRVGSRSLGNRG